MKSESIIKNEGLEQFDKYTDQPYTYWLPYSYLSFPMVDLSVFFSEFKHWVKNQFSKKKK